MHIVEIGRHGCGLADYMGQMRDWLDAHRIEPLLFQFDRSVFRLGFAAPGEAAAFAAAFGGQVIGEPGVRAA